MFYEGSVVEAPVSTTSVNDGNWHQIVAVFKAGWSKFIYVDGSPAESIKASEPFIGNSAPFLIGGSGPVPVGAYSGLIDDVQIYNHALSDGDVDFLFQHPGQVLTTLAAAIAHWTFDEASGPTAHDSAGSFDGTLSSTGAAFVAGGVSGNALSLDRAANGFVNMGNVLGLTSGDFSIVAWVKMNAGDRTDTSLILSKQAAYTHNGYFLNVNKTGGRLVDDKASFYEGGTGVSPITIAETPISTTSVNDGNWHQVVAVYQAGGNKSIYVDGAPAEDLKPSQAFVGNSVALLIGGLNFSGIPTGQFTGLIDDVQIYNRAVSPGDVDFLFQHPGQTLTPIVPAPSGLVSWWQAESNALDVLGHNNGTAVGGVTYAPGVTGSAFSLSGSPYVSIPNPTFSAYSNGFTVAAWIKINSYNQAPSIINMRTPANSSGFTLEPYYGNPGTMLWAVNQTGVSEAFSLLTAPGWQLNTFYHIAATFDAATGTMALYRDGVQVAYTNNLPHTSMATVSNPSFRIGRNIVATGFAWNGLIDDARFYDHALSAADVDFLFHDRSPIVPECSQQLAAANASNAVLQAQLAVANAANAALQAQLVAAYGTNTALQTQLATANVTVASLQAQLAAANNDKAALQTQLAAANGTITSLQAQLAADSATVASLQAQLATCNNALASANQHNQELQDEILGLLLPLQTLTHDWQIMFHQPSFQIPGPTPVEQMQNLVKGIEDLHRLQQRGLFIKLGGHKIRRHKEDKD